MSTINYEINYKPSTKDQDTSYYACIDDKHIFLVLDGHGSEGKEYVAEAKSKFAEKLALIKFDEDINSQIINIFNTINDELNTPKYYTTGTTATLVIILKDKMIIATVGDSDVYLFDENHNLQILNSDHNGTSKAEMERITKDYPNTLITYNSRFYYGQKPVWTNGVMNPIDPRYHNYKNRMQEPAIYFQGYMGYGLAVSRSIGDYHLKSSGIICLPDIKEFPLPSTGSQLLVASDGFWDCWSKEELVKELSDIDKRKIIHQTSIDMNSFYFGTCPDDNTLIRIQFIEDAKKEVNEEIKIEEDSLESEDIKETNEEQPKKIIKKVVKRKAKTKAKTNKKYNKRKYRIKKLVTIN